METVNLRENLIDSINTLPSDILEELNKFLNFLKYKNLSNSDGLEDNTLSDYMKTPQFQKDREKLQSTYADVINGKATLLSENEYNEKMNSFVADLKIKYADN